MMNTMRGIDRWNGLSALCLRLVAFPGALPRAGMKRAVGPSALRRKAFTTKKGNG